MDVRPPAQITDLKRDGKRSKNVHLCIGWDFKRTLRAMLRLGWLCPCAFIFTADCVGHSEANSYTLNHSPCKTQQKPFTVHQQVWLSPVRGGNASSVLEVEGSCRNGASYSVPEYKMSVLVPARTWEKVLLHF